MHPALARWASGNNDALKVKQVKTFTFNFTLIPNGNVFCNHFFEIVSVIIAKTSLKSKTVDFPFARSEQCALCSNELARSDAAGECKCIHNVPFQIDPKDCDIDSGSGYIECTFY